MQRNKVRLSRERRKYRDEEVLGVHRAKRDETGVGCCWDHLDSQEEVLYAREVASQAILVPNGE